LATVITRPQLPLTSMCGDIQEDLVCCIVDAATNLNDLYTPCCITHCCEMGKNVYKTDILNTCYSSENPGYVKSCTTIKCPFLL
jgi:hypothetical protein